MSTADNLRKLLQETHYGSHLHKDHIHNEVLEESFFSLRKISFFFNNRYTLEARVVLKQHTSQEVTLF